MTHEIDAPTKNLALGIAAARAGRFETARRYLTAVLAQAPENVTAMYWMAFVAPTPQQSIACLKRVLALEPDSRRAKAGLRWAEQRLAQVQAKAELSNPIVELAVDKRGGHATQPKPAATHLPETPVNRTVAPRREANRWLPFTAAVIIAGCIAVVALSGWFYALRPSLFLQTKPSFQPKPTNAVHLVQTKPSPSALNLTEVTVKYLDVPEANASSNDSVAANYRLTQAETAELADETDESTTVESSSATELQPQNDITAVEVPLHAAPGQMVETIPHDVVRDRTQVSAPTANDPADEGKVVVSAEIVMNGVRLFEPVAESELVHQLTSVDEKWIEVDITAQRVTAWEGNVPVMSFLASTGLPDTPTVLGKYNIYWKLESTLMTGPDYYLPEVPYTMYFYGGYGLHGAYWHSNFGQRMSHGCVNLSIADSKALFEWADPIIPPGQSQVVASAHNPGTLVIVHASS